MRKRFLLALILVLVPVLVLFFSSDTQLLQGRFSSSPTPLGATTYYVSPTGTGSGLTFRNPTDFGTALGSVKDGDRIILRKGTYSPLYTYAVNSSIEITTSREAIIDCTSVSHCMEVASGKTLDISGLDFIDYVTGIYVEDAELDADQLDFSQPRSADSDAIVLSGSSASGTVQNSGFSNMSIGLMNDLMTGIIVEDGASAIIHDNFMDGQVWGISLDEDSGAEVYDNIIQNTYSAINIEGEADREIYSNELTDNEVGICGTAVGETLIYENHIENGNIGICIYNYNSSLGTSNAEIYGNTIRDYQKGMEIRHSGSSPVSNAVYENTFYSNQIGLHLMGDDYSVVERNHFDTNITGIQVGYSGLTGYDNHSTVQNNLLEDSISIGMAIYEGSGTVAFNTIVNGNDKGVLFGNQDQTSFVNNIVFGNTNEGIDVDSTANGTPNIGTNNSFGNGTDYSGAPYNDLGGNVSVNPGFVSVSDFDLVPSSVMIDAASTLYSVSEDYDGNTRGSLNDIGAFEY